MGTRYHFVTTLDLASQPAAVDTTLRDIVNWPAWWKWARRIEPLSDAPSGTVGARHRNTIATPLFYRFTYDTEIVETGEGMILVESSGDLTGFGLFVYRPSDDGVHLSFTWLVETPRWWMNLIGPMARPIFVWNHDHLMTNFGEGLARASGGELIAVSHATLRPTDPGFFEFSPSV
ncbi:MAG TPA: hypothetical protein VMS74_11645 [Acidimicrobiia bacterium]|nr:hypothetical protein [Acidimicrobiia bacterium]